MEQFRVVEVFADVVCPFTHVGLRRITAERDRRGRYDVVFRVRAWPLEKVNGVMVPPEKTMANIVALRATVAPELFTGFQPEHYPSTSIPALALEIQAGRLGLEAAERASLALRTALFEEGRDVSDRTVLDALAAALGIVPAPSDAEAERAVTADWEEGMRRGVVGSPHFFADGAGFFCPSLEITRTGGTLDIAFDEAGFERFMDLVFADPGPS